MRHPAGACFWVGLLEILVFLEKLCVFQAHRFQLALPIFWMSIACSQEHFVLQDHELVG